MGERGRRRVREHFDVQRTVLPLLSLFQPADAG